MKYLVVLLGLCVIATTVYGAVTPVVCNPPCGRIYHPVCGKDGETYKIYANDCLRKCAGAELAHVESCPELVPQNFVEAFTDKFLGPPDRK